VQFSCRFSNEIFSFKAGKQRIRHDEWVYPRGEKLDPTGIPELLGSGGILGSRDLFFPPWNLEKNDLRMIQTILVGSCLILYMGDAQIIVQVL
jgi:hypothetical protein